MLPTELHRHKFLLLDGMRGLAAIFIAYFHFEITQGGSYPQKAYLAVDFFFCLSGFVLAHAYESKLNDGMSLQRFLLVRIIRLYPLYILSIFLGVCLQAHLISKYGSGNADWRSLIQSALTSVFMLPTFGTKSNQLYPIDVPAWSLFFEIAANILFAAFVIRRVASSKFLALIATASLIVLLAIAIEYPKEDPNYGWSWGNFWGGFPRVCYSFFVGVLVFRLWKARTSSGRTINLTAAAIVAPAILVLSLSLRVDEKWNLAYDRAITAILYPILIYFAASINVNERLRALFAVMGTISYALYITHSQFFLVSLIIFKRLTHLDPQDFPTIVGILSIGFACILCVILDLFYDLPVRRWATRLMSQSARPSTIASKEGSRSAP